MLYDDRWGKSLTMKDFFKRRLIRLHPMVIMGAVLGAITFCIQGECAMGRDARSYLHDNVVSALYDLLHSCHAGCWGTKFVATVRCFR